jgi:uncharacterized membrane protein
MPVSTMIVLAGVVAMFTIFACALAWAQLQTRHLTGAAAPAGAANRPKPRPF